MKDEDIRIGAYYKLQNDQVVRVEGATYKGPNLVPGFRVWLGEGKEDGFVRAFDLVEEAHDPAL